MIPLLAVAMTTQTDANTRVDQFLAAAREQMKIPGLAFAIVKDGKVVHEGAVGVASLTYDVKATPKTPFLLASITKQFTAAGIMRLVEEGKVKLDEPIGTYIGDVPEAWKPITVRHLLTHTAGVKDRFEEKDFSLWRLKYTTQAMMDAAKATPVDFAPGKGWQYSDQGYFLLGRILELASGKSYRDYLQESFFRPLEMTATTTSLQTEVIPGLAEGYSLAGGKHIHNHRRTDYGLVSHFGIVSTVGDLAKWAIALTAGKALKPESVRQMWTNGKMGDGTDIVGAGGAYGFGWFLDEFNGHRIVQHGGASGTAFYTLPDDRVAIVVLTNLEQLSGGNATALATSIAKIYVPGLAWANIKPLADQKQETAMTAEVERVMTGGDATADLYDPTYWRAFQPAVRAQKASLANFGKPKAVELLFVKTRGATRTLGYRFAYPVLTLYITVGIGPDGKIRQLGAEAENLP